MPECHERNKEKTELVFRRECARAEYELPLFESDTSGRGSPCLGAVTDVLSNIKVNITDSGLQNSTLNTQEIATNVTQHSSLNLTESCFNQEAHGSQHNEEVSNHERVNENRKTLDGDDEIVESKHSVVFIGNEVSVSSREKSFTDKDDTAATFESNSPKQSASFETERWNNAQTEQEVSEIVCDTLRLISEVLHLEGEQTEVKASCSVNQETQLMQESTKLDKSDTKKNELNVSQDRACAKRDSFHRSQTINTEQSTGDDPREISPVLHDAPLIFPETSNIAISTATESSAGKREKPRFIRNRPSMSDVESGITSDVTETRQTDLIDSGQANPPGNSFTETNTQQQFHIEVKTHPDGGWGWVVCLGAFLVQFIALGMQNTAGIVYTELVKELKSQRGATGWHGFNLFYFKRVSEAVSVTLHDLGILTTRIKYQIYAQYALK